eukprot:NODE_838_length_1296_cov_178.792302_g637_i0.p1 GENE.NODE_838_length_1296_cov_178.792302_g637_i0~~NODE_838_length_1296_cov_178.792302_g637_i0.p1  ORF type:complete len:362 (-),score=69.76 NODE_838_length_1296_cov_178.792302_g637_i0:210-1253(-)
MASSAGGSPLSKRVSFNGPTSPPKRRKRSDLEDGDQGVDCDLPEEVFPDDLEFIMEDEVPVQNPDASALVPVSCQAAQMLVRVPRAPELLGVARRSFMLDRVSASGLIGCRIIRNIEGANKLFPRYVVVWERTGQVLAGARRRIKDTRSNYVISINSSDLSRHSQNCIGRLRSNLVGTQFAISTADDPRQCAGCIWYQTNKLGGGPRKMQVCIPELTKDGQPIPFEANAKWDDVAERCLTRMKAGDLSDTIHMANRKPVWNAQRKTFQLGMGGRAAKSSVKNFQLALTSGERNVVLQVGKVSKNEFTFDFGAPLSGLQAFAIALSSLEHNFRTRVADWLIPLFFLFC